MKVNKNAVLIVVGVILAAIAVFAVYGLVTRHGIPNEPAQQADISAPAAGQGESESEYLASAVNYEKTADLLKAREAYQKLIEKYPGSNNISRNQESLENLNIAILFSPIPTADSFFYEVQKGDTLTRIAKSFNTTVDLISRSNNLKDPGLKAGRKLKITKAKFSMIIDKSQNILTLKSDQDILKTYRASTGKNSCTPTGTFAVTNKIIDPPWYPSAGGVIPANDPKNVLGSRWIGISKQGYGIHGTIDPESIGKGVTEGCVRLKNSDVEELYSIVPAGAEVIIVD